MSVMFDTLKLAQLWEESGVPAEQARRMVTALRDQLDANAVTKADLRETELRLDGRSKEFEARMDGRFKEFEARMDGRFKELETRIEAAQVAMIKWFAGILIAQSAAIVALIKLI
jgi:hypothetical protein